MGGEKKPYAGVDLAAARETLAGAPAPRLHTDWLAVDLAGHYAVFLGDEASALPPGVDVEATSSFVEAIRASFNGFAGPSVLSEAYRNPAHRAREPVFDIPRASVHDALHEERYSGYPHLVFATADGAALVREAMVDLGGREALTRGPFAVVIDDMGPMTYAKLHDTDACEGCRVLDDPRDPRARSPEMLASVGLYVFGWYGSSQRLGSAGWIRITSPGVAADAGDVEAIGGARVGTAAVELRFDDTPWLRSDLVPE
jgi:hypothetical protein